MIATKKNRRKKGNSENKNFRINVLFAIIVFITVATVVRLFDLQVLKNGYYTALASGQHNIFENLVPERGQVYVEDKFSKDLYPLAINKEMNLIYAVPKKIEDPKHTAEQLAPILEMEEEELYAKLSKENDLYEPLKHKLEDEQVEEIENKELKGIYFQPESLRYYPDHFLASHLLGFVGFVDNDKRGLYGVEGYYDNVLAGKEGYLETEKDALGRLVSVGNKFLEEAEDGSDLVLTIDRLIQFKVERYLEEGVKEFGAESGSITIADPQTGEIIAMASYPDFDPNNYSEEEDVNVFTNSVIYDLYEPGSVFKPVIVAAAMNSSLVSPGTVFQDSGAIEVDEFTIKNFDGKANGSVTVTNILENSINIGMVQIAQLLGDDRTFSYMNKFGFTDMSGIDLDVEASTSIKSPIKWADSDLATASFGQGFSITPLRLITAYTAIANNGKLMQPHIVKKIIKADGSEEVIEPKEVREVLAPGVANTLSAMLTSVIENGQAGAAGVPGYKIAGKSGTAQVPNKDKVGYDPNKKITSFIGFGPIDNPKFLMLVKLDNPGGDVWGASTAGVIFGRVARELFQYYQIPPTEIID
ncbi:MAG: penicillin-binding protein 2 [Parcubacteria group bacterium]|nr:penicillin-binding protein 2 [Parcubacteria group bacterium]